nr:reverse transcriptase domain-containing protein [Tanacetum cinerariifolium]
AGRPAAASQGGGTGGRAGRGGGRTGGRLGDQGNDRIDGQVGGQGDQGRGQGNGRNQNGDTINDNIRGDVRNIIENNDHKGCTCKEFLACNPKEYDEKGGAIHTLSREVAVGMSWDNFKVWMREEFCPSNEMQKLENELWNLAMVRAGHAAYTDRFHDMARLVPHLVTLENRRIGRSVRKEEIGGEPRKDKNRRDDNKRARTGNDFATTANPVRREYTGKDCA